MGGGGLLNFDIEWRGGLQKITNLPLNFANPPYALINESPLMGEITQFLYDTFI
jgi:hypothetical protein